MADTIAENDPLAEGTSELGGVDLVVVGYHTGQALRMEQMVVGFIAGRSQDGVAVCSFVRVRQIAAGSRVVVRALFEAWADVCRQRGHSIIVAGVPREPERYRRVVEIMLQAAGFECYQENQDEKDWFRAVVPARRAMATTQHTGVAWS
jgi:hypothetical protein